MRIQQEKTNIIKITVLITSTRSWVEYTKANGITESKELGKITL